VVVDGGEVMKKPPTFARALVNSLMAFVGLIGVAVLVAAAASDASAAQRKRVDPAAPAQAAWFDNAGTTARMRSEPADAATSPTPLGSLWKLFVYAWLVDTSRDEPAYRCEAAARRGDDEFCCDPGDAVKRDAALQRSCGAYFEPQRIGLDAQAWRAHWQGRAAPAWLHDLESMKPDRNVRVDELLGALRSVSDRARSAARAALLPNTTRDAKLLAALGSGPRFKTWTWSDAHGERIGGAAGWLADGSPFWVGGAGSGRHVIERHAGVLAQRWGTRPVEAAAQPCVNVSMFARYPLREVLDTQSRAAAAGPMQGKHRLRFVNGQELDIDATPELHLERTNGANDAKDSRSANGAIGAIGTNGSRITNDSSPRIEARLLLEDYVARVLDREGDARETAAAQALAVAARSWLVANAPIVQGCHAVADDSRAQRVSPNAPTAAARAAAAHTTGLVLAGAPLRYHRDTAAPDVMAWSDAVAAHHRDQSFDAILRHAFPRHHWASVDGASACEALPEAAAWLREREHRWRATLRAQAGFEPVAKALHVCRLELGLPHADARAQQIRIREWFSRDGRVALTHEYLHLAFARHPRGADEDAIERLALELVDR
jgi:uncharacterized protein YfaQ (DUF2300 family)